MSIRLITCGSVSSALLAFACTSASAASLSIKLDSPQYVYVLGEPVKLRVTLQNDSTETIRIVHLAKLGQHMEFMHYELVEPSGSEYLCWSQLGHVHRALDPLMSGEPLRPGEAVVAFLYPRKVFKATSPTGAGRRGSVDLFAEPGTYRLRIVYGVSKVYERLWYAGQNGRESNELILTFRPPDSKEREILDARAAGWNMGAAAGELDDHAAFDEDALRRVIRKYPDHPLAKYARFALARSLTRIDRDGIASTGSEGVAIFESLRERVPDFRGEEISKQLGTAYYHLGDRNKAVHVFEDALVRYPHMRLTYAFMASYIRVLTNDPGAVQRWSEGRSEGRKGLELIPE
jgi:hypothetical protein